MKVDCALGPDSILLVNSWTNSDLRAADRVVLVDSQTKRFAIASVRTVSGERKAMCLALNEKLEGLAESLGREPTSEWKDVLLYRYEPSNEDFVYRHNRHEGGRGHGVKFNGTRGWIADNHFENVTGNAVHVGFTYTEAISGVGASDVVVSGNTIVYSGWTPITCLSLSGFGHNLIIRGNRITDPREAAISLTGCRSVTLSGNEFSSAIPPSKGKWVLAENIHELHATDNKHPKEVPLTESSVRSQ